MEGGLECECKVESDHCQHHLGCMLGYRKDKICAMIRVRRARMRRVALSVG